MNKLRDLNFCQKFDEAKDDILKNPLLFYDNFVQKFSLQVEKILEKNKFSESKKISLNEFFLAIHNYSIRIKGELRFP